MNDFIIVTDLGSDFPQKCIKHDVPVISMPFTVNGVERNMHDGIMHEEFYKMLKEGALTKTSQIDLDDAERIFTSILNEGKDILYLTFSSGMSGSYNSALLLKKSLEEKFPGRRIVVVDSLSGAGGLGLMTYYAYKMYDMGKTLDEIAEFCNENKLSFSHYFIVRDIKFLEKGGRISKVEALIGSILRINPVLSLSIAGKITPVAKAIGKNKAIKEMLDIALASYDKTKNDFILLGHAGAMNDVALMQKYISNYDPSIRTEVVYVGYPVSAHAGAEALAIFFVGGERKN